MTPRETELLTAQVAALEAEVMRLRDVIFDMAGEEPGISWGKADKALSAPFTPTALTELIEKVEKMTIERCAGICHRFGERQMHPLEAEGAIRRLPIGQIKLEELL